MIAATVSGLSCKCRFRLPTNSSYRPMKPPLFQNSTVTWRWRDPQALALAMEKEAYHKDLISDGVHMHFALKTLVEQYLSGTHVAPPPLPSLRAGADEIRHRLPLKSQYNKHLQEGRKIIEGRINSGIPASISERETSYSWGPQKCGCSRCEFPTFADMLERFGVASVLL